MKILLVTHSFNSLTQRLFVELTDRGDDVSIEFDIHDQVTEEAVHRFEPDLIIAPFLRRSIPESIWKNHTCLIVHPGIPGDRGPSALDWAILTGQAEWGVTLLQAEAAMDAGPIWASRRFSMRQATKSNLYRAEITEAAVVATLEAIEKFQSKTFIPQPQHTLPPDISGTAHPLMTTADCRINWKQDSTEQVLTKINARDGSPGAIATIAGQEFHLYNAHPDTTRAGHPSEILSKRNGAICIATQDASIWISHLKDTVPQRLKLPADMVLAPEQLHKVPEAPSTWRCGIKIDPHYGIDYDEQDQVGYLSFNFLNGAMSTQHCRDLLTAYRAVKQRPVNIIVLLGGKNFWSNGIDLNQIENDPHPAQASLDNINAMNDLVKELILTDKQITIAALQGNAGAGGVFLALACDQIWARQGIILNPHYKNIGNLYGSEYWTYLLPKKIGLAQGMALMANRLPIGVNQALSLNFIDKVLANKPELFIENVQQIAHQMAADPTFPQSLERKQQQRVHDDAQKPLQHYREEEMEKMNLNFFGFDPSYHVARYNFVHKVPKSRTPLYLATHRAKLKNLQSSSR